MQQRRRQKTRPPPHRPLLSTANYGWARVVIGIDHLAQEPRANPLQPPDQPIPKNPERPHPTGTENPVRPHPEPESEYQEREVQEGGTTPARRKGENGIGGR